MCKKEVSGLSCSISDVINFGISQRIRIMRLPWCARPPPPPPRRRGEAFLFKKGSKCGPSIATLPESGVASRAPGIKPRRVWPPVANTNSVHWQYGNCNDNSLTPAQGTERPCQAASACSGGGGGKKVFQGIFAAKTQRTTWRRLGSVGGGGTLGLGLVVTPPPPCSCLPHVISGDEHQTLR